jgi:hypothetical protein
MKRQRLEAANRSDCAVPSHDAAVLASVHALRCALTRPGGLRRGRWLRAAACCTYRRRRTDGAVSAAAALFNRWHRAA